MFTIPGYTPMELLHRGEAAVIYRGHRDADDEKVIIKTHRSDFPTALDRAKLRHEYVLLEELAGPGITAVDPLYLSGGRVALVMEDVGLGSLDRLLTTRLDLGLVLRIILGVITILVRAHQRGIVHKDIKPHNILVGTAPVRVYLIDWGIATRLYTVPGADDGTELPEEGTLAYIAPEQTGMLNRTVDARADLYSLGVTFYELLVGERPFMDDNLRALLQSHLLRTPRPPREVDPRVPGQVSDIVMKLLEKSPDDRYANARGLERDLAECLSQWDESGRIVPFPLGRYDRSTELRIPERLYGREAELAAVFGAFERAQRGAAELFLLTGFGGIGKSAIFREARGPMRLRGARVCAGKFEQFRDATPYAALVEAFRELVRQIMTEPVLAVAGLRARVLEALGQNAGLMIELIPELERVLGPQPPVPALRPTQEENRWNLTLQRFVSVLATAEQPLVLFLDDLQWAEPASLKLIGRLLTEREQRHLLIIGAYRDHDPERIELLTRTIKGIAEASGKVSNVTLRPLDAPDACRFIADALHATTGEVASLSEEIYRKTQGNPFFVGQLLTSLAQDRLLSFDELDGAWRWDLPAIAARTVTDNVASFMVGRLERLAPATLHLLKLASCLGAAFDHTTLARIAGQSTPACASSLWDALVEGLVVPLHEDYRLLRDLSGDDDDAVASRVTYRFLHDRVREAAYSLLDDGEKSRVHREIARLYRAAQPEEVPEDSVFTVADHLNIGRELVNDRADRLAAAALNLRAGRRAKAKVAHEAARSYLAAGASFLPEDAWDTVYELAFALRIEHAVSAFLCGDFASAEALFDDLLTRARDVMLEADVHIARLQLYALPARFGDAVRIGRMALSALGAPVPETEDLCQAAFDVEVKALEERLRGLTLEELVAAAPMRDPRATAALRLLLLMDTPSFGAGEPKLSALVTLRQVALSLEHGPAAQSACGYAGFGLMMLRMFGRSPEVDLLTELAVALEDRYPCPEYAAQLGFARANTTALTRPPAEAIAQYDRCAEVGLQHGDRGVSLVSTSIGLAMRLLAGDDELASISAGYERYKATMQRQRDEAGMMVAQAAIQAIKSLKDPVTVGSIDPEDLDEAAFLARAREKKVPLILGCHWLFNLAALGVHADHDAAAPFVEEAEERRQVFGQALRAQSALYMCLHLIALIEHAVGADVARYYAMFDENERTLREQRALCEEAWRAPCVLVAAERARLVGEDMEAERLYNEALDLAQQDGRVRVFAMASELYGKFCVKKRLVKVARGCLSDAYQAWLSWGAVAKAYALAARFPRYVVELGQPQPVGRSQPTTRGTATVALQGVLFDLGEAMRAAHAISSEIVADRVIEQFLRAASRSAAARRAFVLLLRGEELMIGGRLTTNPDVLWAAKDEPVSLTAEVSAAVVRFVARSREPVILGGAELPAEFADDPYLREHRPRSLLCLPLIHHDRLLGVWYAERAAANELRQGTIELLQLLAGQAGSALANARLYEQLKDASLELSDKNDRLERELVERERIEREQAALRERVIEMQDELLLQLSTPLIPISERVIVIPIVGTIGEKRTSHMVETILSGVHERRARAVIMDVTGMQQVDDATTRVLLKTASALRLLGVLVVLTGVRPDAARAVVDMGVDMSGITVLATLQAGIAFAVRQAGVAAKAS